MCAPGRGTRGWWAPWTPRPSRVTGPGVLAVEALFCLHPGGAVSARGGSPAKVEEQKIFRAALDDHARAGPQGRRPGAARRCSAALAGEGRADQAAGPLNGQRRGGSVRCLGPSGRERVAPTSRRASGTASLAPGFGLDGSKPSSLRTPRQWWQAAGALRAAHLAGHKRAQQRGDRGLPDRSFHERVDTTESSAIYPAMMMTDCRSRCVRAVHARFDTRGDASVPVGSPL